MSRMTPLICFLCLVLFGNISQAQVSATVDTDGFIVLIGSNVELIGVDLMSGDSMNGGNLIPVPSDEGDPFEFLLQNEDYQIAYGSLLGTVSLDGTLKLSAGFDLTADYDLNGEWGGPVDGPLPLTILPPIPEPGSLTLLLAGIGCLGMLRRPRSG